MLNERIKKIQAERKIWIGIVSISMALNCAPAFADDGFGDAVSGFFSGIGDAIGHIFHSPTDSDPTAAPSPVPSVAPSIAPSQSPDISPSPDVSLDSVPVQTSSESTGKASEGPVVTHDSSYRLSGSVPAGMHWILVDAHLQNQGELKNAPYTAVKEGDPLPMVYLPYGPGLYTIQVYFLKEADVTGGHFSSYSQTQVYNDDAADHSYLLPSIMVQSDAPEIVELSKQITQNLVTDREKALAIHDWIARNISYDDAGVKNRTYTLNSFDALSILRTKLTVCEGYSTLFAALARASGLKARVELGKAFNFNRPSDRSDEQICQSTDSHRFYPHGWNEVMIDNRWVTVDTTFDSQYSGMGALGHEYFDRKSSEFETTHLKCNDADW